MTIWQSLILGWGTVLLCGGSWADQAPSAASSQPAAGNGRAYVIRFTESERKIKVAMSLHKDSFNMYAARLVEALAEKLGEHGFTRADMLAGTCCKVTVELLDIVPDPRGGVEVSATVAVTDAAGQQVYFNSYNGQARSRTGGARASIERAGDDLADKVVRDSELVQKLAAKTDARAARAAAMASVTVSSVPLDADIEINGSFSGNTPSTLKLAPGEYRIVVKKEGYQPWERTLQAGAGAAISVNAELVASEAHPPPAALPPAPSEVAPADTGTAPELPVFAK